MPDLARLHGLKFILRDSSLAYEFESKQDQLAHVVFGLEPTAPQMNGMIEILRMTPRYDSFLVTAIVELLPWEDENRSQTAREIVKLMLKPETASYDRSRLSKSLSSLAARMPKSEIEVKKWASALVERMAKSETASDELSTLGETLGMLATRLPKGDADVKKWALPWLSA